MDRYICVHGHFYQPPRENPWLEEIELQDSAYPYHDWNERISAECYAPNSASRILNAEKRIIAIVNNYSRMSFNFGPTLLHWMENHDPETYQAILEADRLSKENFTGHGSALAQIYNHMIMPLANKRDKITQVIWGIRDFERRFKRRPEGMWLPETAVDIETLEVLAENGLKFTILSPGQAKRSKRIGRGAKWIDHSGGRVDPTMVYLTILPSGRRMNLFFYDGPVSHDLAFGGLLKNGEEFAGRLTSVFSEKRTWPQLVHIATDGETYGHHHSFGDMALAYGLYFIDSRHLAKITNYGEYLEKHPPTYQVEIYENTSWSCVHGLERWRDNCGCNSGMKPGWQQNWRKPLREAFDKLRDRLIPIYEQLAGKYLTDPWKALNDYIDLISDRSVENVERFFEKHSRQILSFEEKQKILKLLEMQRNTMLMFTSCGWFFDEISGLETTQILMYSARAIQLAEEVTGQNLEPDHLLNLEQAPSNIAEYGNGAGIYEILVKPARLDPLRVGAHYAISSIFEEFREESRIYCYSTRHEAYEKSEAGKMKLVTGRRRITSDITWDEVSITFAVVHLGDHHVNGGVRLYAGEASFQLMHKEITEAFRKGDAPEVIRLMDKHFATNNYSLWHLFRDQQRKVINKILEATLRGIEDSFHQLYENSYPIMTFLHNLRIPLPREINTIAGYVVGTDIKRIFSEERLDLVKLEKLVRATEQRSLEIDKEAIAFIAGSWINTHMASLKGPWEEDLSLLEQIEMVLKILQPFNLELDLWKAQNIYFSMARSRYGTMKDKAERGDELSRKWVTLFLNLGRYLEVKASE